MLTNLLIWLDNSPWRYGSLCVLAYLSVLALCLVPASASSLPHLESARWRRWLRTDTAFLLALAVMLFAFRWQVFYFPQHLNPDESGYISQTLTLAHDPVFWRSVTAGTSGPLNIYPRLIPVLLGLPDNYFTARVMALVYAIGFLTVFFFTWRRFAHASLARLATLSAATFLALTTNGDFTHASGEHLPVLLLALAAHLALWLPDAGKKTSLLAFLAGVAVGAVPFAKLQGGVLALTITFFCYAYLLGRNEAWGKRLIRCGCLTLGGLTMPAVVAASAAATGQFEHFWQSYVVMNLGYAGNGVALSAIIANIPNLRPFMPRFVTLFNCMLTLGVLGLMLIGFVRCGRPVSKSARRLMIFFTTLLVVAIYTALAPGRPFPHYFLFVVLPAAGWALACFNAALGAADETSRSSDSQSEAPAAPILPLSLALAIWVAVGLTAQLCDHFFSQQLLPTRGHVAQYLQVPRSQVADAILRHASPGEALALWGWMHQFHAETGMRKATSDQSLEYLWNTKTEGVNVASWMDLVPDYFEELYVADMKRSYPPVFVDAVAPGSFVFADRAMFGYQTFPALAEYINEFYVLAEEIDGIRIFARKDRQ